VTTQQRACNVQACPVDCEVSSWAAWSVCAPCAKNVDKTVEGGQQERTRLCTKSAAHGGACPDLKEQQGCNAPLCPTTTVTSTTTTTTMTTTTTTTTTSTTTTTTTTITRGVSAKFPGQICVQTARLQAYSSKDYIACQDACRENVACNRFAIPNSLTCDSSLGIRPDDCFLYKRDSENCACELGDLACMTTYELTGGTGGDDLEGALSRDAHPEGTLLEDDAAPDFPEPFKKP